jgi:hypothetical protein
LERYTLLAATGLAASDTDSDGNAGGSKMDEEDYIHHKEQLEAANNMPALQKAFAAGYKAAGAASDESAQKKLTKRYEERKLELR